jgi:hypothetical protein
MNIKSTLPTLLASAALLVGTPLFAQHGHGGHHGAKKETSATSGKLVPVTEKEAAWADKARQDYPLDVCLTSDEKLGSMGKPPEFIYRVDGKPDRLVIFCCSGCEDDFLEDPSKYLAKLDATKSGKGKMGGKKKDAHKGHH